MRERGELSIVIIKVNKMFRQAEIVACALLASQLNAMSAGGAPEQAKREIVYSRHHLMENFGGDGKTVENRRIYKVIEAGDVTGNADLSLNLELYSKWIEDSEKWQLHGNLVLSGSEATFKNRTTRFGWLFSNDNSMFDGLGVEYVWSRDTYTQTDFWNEGKPDVANEGYSSLTTDESISWNINAEKSLGKASCSGSSCSLKAHFFRDYETLDNQDFQLEPFFNEGYLTLGYAEVESSRGIVLQAQSNDKYVLLGAKN